MAEHPIPVSGSHYQIRVRGVLDQHWSDWFEGLAVDRDGDETVISGRLLDQAALHGVLHKIRDLDLFLIAVVCLDAGVQKAQASTTPPRS